MNPKTKLLFITFPIIIHIIYGKNNRFTTEGSGGSFGDDDENRNGGFFRGNIGNVMSFVGDEWNAGGKGRSLGGNNGGQGGSFWGNNAKQDGSFWGDNGGEGGSFGSNNGVKKGN